MRNNYTIEILEENLLKENYVAGKNLIYALFTAIALEKPLLIDGPPGVGKTELAKVVAKMFETDLIRLQCYEGIDCSKVLYEYNYAKQLSCQNVYRDGFKEMFEGKSFDEAVDIIEKEVNMFDDRFIIKRPILEALVPSDNKMKVCLLDEIDKTDSEVEAMLLEPLSDYSMSIPERGTIVCNPETKPFFILTSNNQRELSEALRRRCVYVYVEYPSLEVEASIIQRKANVDFDIAKKVAGLVNKIREKVKLRQYPSTSESIEWANLLVNTIGVEDGELDTNILQDTLSCIIKNKGDLEKVKEFLKRGGSK